MVGGILFEHGHRLVAAAVSTLVGLELGALLFLLKGRRTVKVLAAAAFVAILLQALLGGLTVLFLLPPAISSAHAALAEIVFALTAVVALMCSKTWKEISKREISSKVDAPQADLQRTDAAARPTLFHSQKSPLPLRLPPLFLFHSKKILVPLRRVRRRGARFGGSSPRQRPSTCRSSSAPSCDTRERGSRFPTSRLPSAASFPPSHELSSPRRSHPSRAPPRGRRRRRPRLSRREVASAGLRPPFATAGAAWAGLVCLQAFLGASSIWSGKAVPLTVAHLAVGALCWVTGVLAAVALAAGFSDKLAGD